jgi:hypothetical protein
MSLIVQNSRTLLKRSQISGATPTVKTGSTQHTDGTWVDTEIYPGEIYWNMQDRIMYIGWEDISGNTGTDVLVTGAGTGSCVSDFYVSNIFGCPASSAFTSQIVMNDGIGLSVTDVNSSLFQNFINIDKTASGGVFIESSDLTNGDTTYLEISTTRFEALFFVQNTNNVIYMDGNGVQLTSSTAIPNTGSSINITPTGIDIKVEDITLANTREINLTSTTISIPNIDAYADDTAAGVGGLVLGDIYETDGTGAAPLNVAGILMRKQ